MTIDLKTFIEMVAGDEGIEIPVYMESLVEDISRVGTVTISVPPQHGMSAYLRWMATIPDD
jgi:hypothetical protein